MLCNMLFFSCCQSEDLKNKGLKYNVLRFRFFFQCILKKIVYLQA